MRLPNATALFVIAAMAACIAQVPWFGLAGVPNFHRVNDTLYRGGQPSIAGLQALSKMGIKTVLDLRMSRRVSDWEEREVKRLGMRYVHLPLYGTETPTSNDIHKAFSVLHDPSQAPVFVHCREGKDRTGMIIGCYRITHDQWTNRRALAEAKSYAGRDLRSAMEQYILQFRTQAPEDTAEH